VLHALAMLAAAAAVLAPWAVRNYQHFGRPIIGTTHGGYTLLLGNNPHFYRHLRQAERGTVWEAAQFQDHLQRVVDNSLSPRHSEVAYDRYLYQLAFRNIHHEPGIFVYACTYRIGQLWSPWPNQLGGQESAARRLLRHATAIWYALLWLLAAGGACTLRWHLLRRPWVWGVLLCLSFTAVHTLYWSNLRMRAPLMPVICLLASVGAGRIANSRGLCKSS
jgi:hypothetical protein